LGKYALYFQRDATDMATSRHTGAAIFVIKNNCGIWFIRKKY
jgi:hypothetical protein